ncbi:MAG: fatty acid desaturase [Myxococcota bacterium]|nr:fatty acid desaturase [Myxococcota bacterium]
MNASSRGFSENDYSNSFSRIRGSLHDSAGQPYAEFVRSLEPDYRLAWRDVAVGYAALAATLVVVWMAGTGLFGLIIALLGAISVGYWSAYIYLFVHAAAHYNMAADSSQNDRLTNLFVCWLSGTEVKSWRRVHLEHHRALGATDDSESSYFEAPTAGFILKTLTGLYALEVMLKRRRRLQSLRKTESSFLPLLYASSLHGLLVLAFLLAGAWPVALAWVLGVGSCFPFFSAVRQMLEHRRLDADPSVDYDREPHGALTRMFGDDLFSRTLGGAGLNRHLLHHWEPQASYTVLPDLESFLLKTEVAPVIESRRSDYLALFRYFFFSRPAA